MWVSGTFLRVEEIPDHGVIAFKRDDDGDVLILEKGDRMNLIHSGHHIYPDITFLDHRVYKQPTPSRMGNMISTPMPTSANWTISSWESMLGFTPGNTGWTGELWIED